MKNELTKGEIMRRVYSEKERRNIDSAIPMECWKTHEPMYHVMNYNESLLGELEDMRVIAEQREILLPTKIISYGG